jgi:acetyltransferase-like isoleucine patch superfamily enzyme
MEIYSNAGYSYHQERYKNAKEEYENNLQRAAEIEEKMNNFTSKVEKLSKEERVFDGYVIRHKYRYVDEFDKKTIGEYLFLTDKEITKVTSKIDLNDEMMKAMIDESKLNKITK